MSASNTTKGTSHISDKVVIMARRIGANGQYEDVAMGSIDPARLDDAMKAAALDPVDAATGVPADRSPEEILAEKAVEGKNWFKATAEKVWNKRKTIGKTAGLGFALVLILYVLNFLLGLVLRTRKPVIMDIDGATTAKITESISTWASNSWAFIRDNAVSFGRWITSFFKASATATAEVASEVIDAASGPVPAAA